MAHSDSNLIFTLKILILFGIMLLGLIDPDKRPIKGQLAYKSSFKLESLFDKHTNYPFIFKKIILK